jgi:hypothetical protein
MTLTAASSLWFIPIPGRLCQLSTELRSQAPRTVSALVRSVLSCHAQHSSDVQSKIDELNTNVLAAIELKSDWGTTVA